MPSLEQESSCVTRSSIFWSWGVEQSDCDGDNHVGAGDPDHRHGDGDPDHSHGDGGEDSDADDDDGNLGVSPPEAAPPVGLLAPLDHLVMMVMILVMMMMMMMMGRRR